MVDVADTLAHLERLETRRREAGAAHAARLRACLPQAAERLRKAGATRVVVFGSLAEAAAGPDADVDLAVEGLGAPDYFHVLADLMALFGTRVDLVRLEEASPSLSERIEAEGQPL
jgi:predicted nucleotidyltransferase